jgi:Na+/phosphate symporter
MFNERELLDKYVESDNSELKEYIIEYVGNKLKPEDSRITIEMVLAVLAEDFPDIVLALAEENFIRGYQQGINDSSGTAFQDDK